jgi:hypothetical protein
VDRAPPSVSASTVEELQMDFVSDLSEIYNDCRKSLQASGQKAKARSTFVSPAFFSSESHCGWRSSFTAARNFLEEKLFMAHPMVLQMHKFLGTSCASLSFFRQIDDEAFPMDETLFHQVQQAQIRYASDVLHSQVMVQARAIFSTIPEHQWVKPHQLDRFVLCLRRVMSLHLETLLFSTLHEVVHLFERFESSSDDKALFIVNLIVDNGGRIRYSPEPEETLINISSLLDKVKDTICSVSVIQCSLVEIEHYNSLMIVSSHEADVMLQGAKAHLREIYQHKMQATVELIQKFDAYRFVLSEPHYEFPANWWNARDAWRRHVPEWKKIWERSRTLRDEIEVLEEDEVDVGLFLAITSGPEEYNLVTEVLGNKALSLGNNIKKTIVSNLVERGTELRDEFEEAYRLCTERSAEPNRLLELLSLLQEVKNKLNGMRSRAEDIDALHQVIMNESYLLQDDEDFCLFRVKNLAAILPGLENQARGFLFEVIYPREPHHVSSAAFAT